MAERCAAARTSGHAGGVAGGRLRGVDPNPYAPPRAESAPSPSTAAAGRELSYLPRWRTILGAGGFFAVCAVVLAYEAATNERGLIVNGILHFDPDGATTFYQVLAGLSLCFVLASIALAVQRTVMPQRLLFGDASMTVPVSRWSRETQTIAYRDVRRITMQRVSGQIFLHVHHPRGKFVIVASMLPSSRDFAQVRDLLQERCGGGK
jgi:hypothetical protein